MFSIGQLELFASFKGRVIELEVESIDPNGPYGAKEAGMSIAMSAAQAYANVICNAIGIWIHEFPMTP